MDTKVPTEWEEGIEALRVLPNGGVALVVGATDRGKTTFTALAARILAAELGKVAVVDADIGQSEIGPPGTVGAAAARADAEKLHDLKPAGVFFVGAFAPNAAALELTVATAQAVRFARDRGALRVLVDTSGFIAGPAARRLKVAKAALVRPQRIITIGYSGEVDSLAAAMAAASGASLVPLEVPETVGRKTPALRSTRRMTRLSASLENATEIRLPLTQTSTLGATLGTGSSLTPELVRWTATTLRIPVVYGELSEGALNLFVEGLPCTGWESASSVVAAHFQTRTVRVFSLGLHEGVYLGLQDEGGRLVSVGRFTGIDPERQEMIVFTPPSARIDRIRLVSFGRVRIDAAGSPVSEVKPGEI